MKYKIRDLIAHVTPRAEKITEFLKFPLVEFEFPKSVKTVLFTNCDYISNGPRGENYFEVIGQLFESENPRETGENLVGRLYVFVHNYPSNGRYETTSRECEL
jgi:hypothetical protein